MQAQVLSLGFLLMVFLKFLSSSLNFLLQTINNSTPLLVIIGWLGLLSGRLRAYCLINLFKSLTFIFSSFVGWRFPISFLYFFISSQFSAVWNTAFAKFICTSKSCFDCFFWIGKNICSIETSVSPKSIPWANLLSFSLNM